MLSHRGRGLAWPEWLSEAFWAVGYTQGFGAEWWVVADFVLGVVYSSELRLVPDGHLLCVDVYK